MSIGSAPLYNTINLIQVTDKIGSDLSISIFPTTNIHKNDNPNTIIFDLTKDGLSLSKLLNESNIHYLEIIHLPIPNTIFKTNDNITFQNILNATLNSNQSILVNNIINNNNNKKKKKNFQYVFYDGESTITNCQMTTFWVMEKFYKYVQNYGGESIQIMVYEPNQPPTLSTIKSRGTISKPQKKRQFNLSLRLPYTTQKSSDIFIESLKEDLVQYSPSSLFNYFHLNSMDILNANNYNQLNQFPRWLRQIIDIKDERAILSTLWTKFNILEHLENMRLKSCVVDNTITQPTFINQENKNIKEKDNKDKKGKDNHIYSLSILQKDFKKQKHIDNNLTNLKVSIPPIVSNHKNNNNNNISNNSPLSDSDVLQTPLFNYEIDKAIQQFQKNRYSNVLPYEHSRVKLRHSDDYFNANYINLPQINNNFKYIATQAPLPNTINDFWEMVWNENVKVIISLNSNEELKLKKWNIYWEDKFDPKTNITVKLLKQWDNFCELDGITLRQFRLTESECKSDSSKEHTLYQLQYSKWLDSCVVNIGDLLKLYRIRSLLSYDDKKFISQVESYNGKSFTIPKMTISPKALEMNEKAPLLVHCSAGCGRTGVFITLDYILNLFRDEIQGNNKIDVWNMEDDLLFIIVNELRKQRISMVQNLAQYIACYDEIIQYFIILIGNNNII
ncbi:tyrosine-protein phosphatase 2 [Monosporozyma servazzii]